MIPISKPSITDLEIAYVNDAVASGWVSSLGSYIDRFESNFAKYCGTRYAVSTMNGTTALHLVLEALGISKGDEVIIPDLTFIATANSIAYTGAKVVTVDIEPNTLCIDTRLIENAITENTKAIVPVHLYGHPADMDAVNKIAEKYKLYVIEDAAEAHGAEYKSRKVGGLGTAGIFSFYGNKIISSGEGGMITTNDEKIYEKARYLRDHAMSKERRYWHDEIGFNYRMTNLQAALGLAQLERIENIIAKKRQTFEWYKEQLSGVPFIKLNFQAPWALSVFWLVCVEINGFELSNREHFMRYLYENKVDSRPYFYPVSLMPPYAQADHCISRSVYQKGINLPSFYDIKHEDVVEICDLIKAYSYGF